MYRYLSEKSRAFYILWLIMENDLGPPMLLAIGLFFLLVGISFLRERILDIKKGHIAIATLFKIEEREDGDGRDYTLFFKYTSWNNQEKIFEHTTKSKKKCSIGDNMKLAYKESILETRPLPLLFHDVFGLSATLMTVGFFLIIISGCIYWEASPQTGGCLIPATMISFVSIFYIWAQKFFKKLK